MCLTERIEKKYLQPIIKVQCPYKDKEIEVINQFRQKAPTQQTFIRGLRNRNIIFRPLGFAISLAETLKRNVYRGQRVDLINPTVKIHTLL